MSIASKCTCLRSPNGICNGVGFGKCHKKDFMNSLIHVEKEPRSLDNTLSGDEAQMIAALIRYGYEKALNDVKEWLPNSSTLVEELLKASTITEIDSKTLENILSTLKT